MEVIAKDIFNELLEKKAAHCISIYLPVHQAGAEVNENIDLIHFKNQLNETRTQLKAKGLSEQKIDEILTPATALLKEEEFWKNLLKGLVIFIADDFFEIIKLPFAVKTAVHVNASFYLAPLISAAADNEYFYVLVLSKNATKLYKGTAYNLSYIHVEGLPQGVNDVIHFEEKSEQKLFRMGGNIADGMGSMHGHGNGLADEKEYISRYLKEVDHTLQTELLANETAPLLLAGLETTTGIYKQVTHYKNTVDEVLKGNFEHVDAQTLLEKALPIMEPHLKTKSKKALQNYYNQLATALTCSMPEKVIPASYFKQIADLFVLQDLNIWGNFDETANNLTLHEDKQPTDECLVNKAILNTLQNGGSVYILNKERMPNGATIAASLRF